MLNLLTCPPLAPSGGLMGQTPILVQLLAFPSAKSSLGRMCDFLPPRLPGSVAGLPLVVSFVRH